jgi:hypothetical protein
MMILSLLLDAFDFCCALVSVSRGRLRTVFYAVRTTDYQRSFRKDQAPHARKRAEMVRPSARLVSDCFSGKMNIGNYQTAFWALRIQQHCHLLYKITI